VCTTVGQVCAQYSRDSKPSAASVDDDTSLGDSTSVTSQVNTAGLSKKAKKALQAQRRNGNVSGDGGDKLPAAAVKIEVVSIVGGMSEHKQRRQLAGKGKPVHIVVATPGRLCEMFEDPENVSFQDMSKLRWLVVDEADRIMEEGHYPEVSDMLLSRMMVGWCVQLYRMVAAGLLLLLVSAVTNSEHWLLSIVPACRKNCI
jgi:hypothetical protein